MKDKNPTRETMRNRLRAVFSPALRSERGALNNALILTIAATLLVVVAATWFMFRQTLDTTTAQQAQVRSSINQLATNVLGQMNQQFPDDWMEMDSQSLTEATEQFGNTPELGATSYLTHFSVNDKTGVVTAEAQGRSTGTFGATAKARIQFVPSGAGVFTGLDSQGRPEWVYSDNNLDALALWEMNPNSIEYLTPGGDYTSEAPTEPPTVTITPRNGGAQAVSTFSPTYCQFGGTAEYRYRVKMDGGEFGSWSAWAATREFSTNLVQGQKIAVQAQARCVTSISATDPTAPSAIAEYTRPVAAPAGPPTLTIANTGIASWTKVVCAPGTTTQYQYRARLNEGSWATWTEWEAGVLSNNTGALQGARVEFQVRARCISPYAQSANSATAHAQIDRPITSVPTKPTVSVTHGANGATTSVSTAAGVSGLTAEYRYRVRVNGGNTWTYGPWAISRSVSQSVNQGDKVEGQGQVRYVSPYVDGAASAESNITVLNVPVTFKPSAPKLTLNDNWANFTIGQVTCPAGTTTRYSWTSTVDGTTRESYSDVSPQAFTRNVSVLEGQTLVVVATANCLGTGNGLSGPDSDQAKLTETRELKTPPVTPTITYAANGAPTWVKGGCPAGTTWESTFRYQENAGGWGAWRAWGTANSAGSPIGQGERVMFDVRARCSTGSSAGPEATATGAWHIYTITSQPSVGGNITLTGNGPITASFTNPTNCPATTSLRTSSRTAVNDTWTAFNGWTTSEANRSIAATDGEVARAQLRAMCVTSYDQGPVYTYGIETRTSTVTSTASGTLNVAFASSWNSFSYTAVTCPTGLTIQYRTVVKEGRNGTNVGGAWGGRVASQAIPKWEYGDDYSVTVQLRCINSYSNTAGPVTSSRTFTDTRPIPTPGQPNVLAQGTTTIAITNNSACPAGQSNLRVETRHLGRVHWAGAWNENGNWEYEKGWSAWDAGNSSYGAIADEGRSAIWYGQQRCRNADTNEVSGVGQGDTGWFIRPVSAGGKTAYRIAYRHFGHAKSCFNGAWADQPWFWITLNRATGWAYNNGQGGPVWEFNHQGGTWGTVDYNSRALCGGPYANGGWQYAGGSY